MFESKVLNIPVVKVFAMTDASNHPFVLSFHYEEKGCNLYFKVTPNRSNPITEIPVYEGTCYTINTLMDMFVAYGCKYIKRLPISKGEVLSKDYLDGISDGSIISKPKTESQLTKSKSKEEIINDFLI